MKKLRFADAISFRILLFVFFVGSMFSACNKSEIQDIEKNISKTQTVEKEALTSKEVSFGEKLSLLVSKRGDFLEFKDDASFYEILGYLSKQTNKDQGQWAGQFGVVSLRSIYDQVVEAENVLLKATNSEVSKLDKEQQKRLEKYGFTSEVALKNIDVISYDKNTGFDMKIYNPHLSIVVNRKGIVKVGKEIRQYSLLGIKTILDGNEAKISLLDGVEESDESKGIRVEKAVKGLSNGRVETGTRTLYCENAGPGSPAQYKLITYDEFYDLVVTGSYRKYTHFFKVVSLKRGFLGYWYSHSTYLYSNGGVSYTDNTNTYINSASWAGGYVNPFIGGWINASTTDVQTTSLLSEALILNSRTPISLAGSAVSNNGIFGCGVSY